MNPGLRWILFVIGLLAGNVVAVVILMTSAGSAGPDRVLPAYYERAAHYDDVLDEERDSALLGWTAVAAIDAGAVEVSLRDAAGGPVRGAHVDVTGYHRAHAGSPIAVGLIEVAPGVYRAAIPRARAGWWDLTIKSSQGHLGHVARMAVEAR